MKGLNHRSAADDARAGCRRSMGCGRDVDLCHLDNALAVLFENTGGQTIICKYHLPGT